MGHKSRIRKLWASGIREEINNQGDNPYEIRD
jgi:hypothetical protein